MRYKAVGLLLIGFLASPLAWGRTKSSQNLTLYGSADPEWIALLAKEFEKETGTKVEWIRESSGVILQRLKAEQEAPKGTVWFGGTFDAHAEAARMGLLERYTSPRSPELSPLFVDPLGTHQSVGVYGGILGFGVNLPLLRKLGKPIPKGWNDLLNPAYKGLIVMANPNTSGTAYTILATVMKLKGEKEGLDYLKKLDKNVAQYTQSGAAVTILVGKGEAAIAVVFLQDVIKDRLKGYPLTEVVPEEGTGYEIGGLSLIQNGPNIELGKKFIDWTLSPEVQKKAVLAGGYQVPANRLTPMDSNIVPFEKVKLVELPIDWLTSNRERFIRLWTQEVFAKK